MKKSIGHGIFITGTDTGIGKTYIARLLLEGFSEKRTATYMKPVQTGCTRDAQGNLTAPDFDYVMKDGAYMSAEMDDHIPYRFEPACSPHLAASRAGVVISLERIRESFCRVSDRKSITIVEGAGGVLTPLSETESMIDLMLYLRLPVVVVTLPRVGTLNHTLLTVEVLAKRGIEPAGLVVNNIHAVPDNFIYHDTIRVLKDRVPGAAFLEIGRDDECNEKVKEFCGKMYEKM
ncbi:MAG: dethiobiotin synthase [Chitinispirillaceae bacterium]|nr:dethiobiotin synthase [Chitinispirillaceae bacterium]